MKVCDCACMYGKARLLNKPYFLKLKGCENVMVPMAISRSMLAPVRILLCVSLPLACYISPTTVLSHSSLILSLFLSSAVVSTPPSHAEFVFLCPFHTHPLIRIPPSPHFHSFCPPPHPLEQPSSACLCGPSWGWTLKSVERRPFFAKINSLSC